MTEPSVTHATFTLKRHYAASPARVFAAFSDFEKKNRWFIGPPGWTQRAAELDFRVGGAEVNVVAADGGPVSTFNAIYQDIVENTRIVYTYEMLMDAARISVSLATIEFTPEGGGTVLTFTEQGAYFDGSDDGRHRRQGTLELLDALGAFLEED